MKSVGVTQTYRNRLVTQQPKDDIGTKYEIDRKSPSKLLDGSPINLYSQMVCAGLQRSREPG